MREISHDTAFMGQSASLFFQAKEVVCDALTSYFTDYEPESCFVAEEGASLVGYLSGAKNKALSERVFAGKILPGLLRRALGSGAFARKKNLVFIFNCLKAFASGGLYIPDFSGEYPATFHINLKKEFRGMGIGSSLVGAYVEYLRSVGVPGVHLATLSRHGADFFSRQSFQLLYTGKRPYFRHILHEDVPLYIFGRKIPAGAAN